MKARCSQTDQTEYSRTMSQRYKVYVTRRIPDPGTQSLTSSCDVTFWDSDDAIPREELLKNVKGMDAILCMLTDKIDGEVLEHAGKSRKFSCPFLFDDFEHDFR